MPTPVCDTDLSYAFQTVGEFVEDTAYLAILRHNCGTHHSESACQKLRDAQKRNQEKSERISRAVNRYVNCQMQYWLPLQTETRKRP